MGTMDIFQYASVFLGIVVGVEKWIIPDVPVQVEQAIERQRLVESVLILGAGVDRDDDGGIQFDPSLEFIDVETLQDIHVDEDQENAPTEVKVDGQDPDENYEE